MEFEQIIKLVKAVSDSSLTGFKYEENGVKIALQKDQVEFVTAQQSVPVTMPVQAVASQVLTEEVAVNVETPSGNVVNSPLVGTFYAAPSEDAKPYIQVGDTVKKGQTIGIVEAMKLMNEIECEFDGIVTEIYVQNGEVVEYGQPLLCIS